MVVFIVMYVFGLIAIPWLIYLMEKDNGDYDHGNTLLHCKRKRSTHFGYYCIWLIPVVNAIVGAFGTLVVIAVWWDSAGYGKRIKKAYNDWWEKEVTFIPKKDE